jgi:hypothetical protein
MASVSLSLRQAGPVSPIALVAIAPKLAADRGFTAADLLGDLALGVLRFHQGRNVVPLLLRQRSAVAVLHHLLVFGNPKV